MPRLGLCHFKLILLIFSFLLAYIGWLPRLDIFPAIPSPLLAYLTFSLSSHPTFNMQISRILPFVAVFGFAIAAPAEKRQAVAMDFNPPPGGDTTILNYALTLEYLERNFYMGGLANFTQAQFVAAGFPDPFYANLKTIYNDEKVCPSDHDPLLNRYTEGNIGSRRHPLRCSR